MPKIGETPRPTKKFSLAVEPVCKACGGTGKNSKGGICVPCHDKGRTK